LPPEKSVANTTQAFPERFLSLQLRQPSCDAPIQDVYQCESCPRKFNNANSLLLHKSTEHEKQRIFACNQCDKTFKVSASAKKNGNSELFAIFDLAD
jgi:DNA-directed RNA polymerase subunit M/transcription elongation factor TFIIS